MNERAPRMPAGIACGAPGRGTSAALFTLLLVSTSIGATLAAPGDLDPTFGSGGRVLLDPYVDYEAATAVLQQADGKLLIGRWVRWPPANRASLVRLNPDGSMDTGFRGAPFAGDHMPAVFALLQQPDGKIVTGGEDYNEAQASTAIVARYDSDGAPDQTFGAGGAAQLGFDGKRTSIRALVRQSDGRIVAAGWTHSPPVGENSDMVFARFNTDGSLDTTFGNGGTLVLDFASSNRADGVSGLALQSDGRLVAAGFTANAVGGTEFAVVRLTRDGAMDTSFDGDGRVTVDLSRKYSRASGIVVQPADGKLVVAGQSSGVEPPGCEASDVVAARLRSDGSLDPTFGEQGWTRFAPAGCPVVREGSLVLDPSGKILIASTSAALDLPHDVYVSRLTVDGQYDGAFGTGGHALVDIGQAGRSSMADSDVGAMLALQSDGRIVVVGSDQIDWDGNGTYFVASRLLATGTSAGVAGMARDWILVRESSRSVMVMVRRTGGSQGAVSVDYATNASNATSGADFTATSGALTWNDGESGSKAIPIAIAEDDETETYESFSLNLSNLTGGASLAGRSTFITLEDTTAPRMIQFETASVSTGEDRGSLAVRVQRTGSSAGAVGVRYSTTAGTAAAGSDYSSTGGVLNWADGDLSPKEITVGITDDADREGNETFTIVLDGPTTGTALGAHSSITVTILANDSPPTAPSDQDTRNKSGGGAIDVCVLVYALALAMLRPGVRRRWQARCVSRPSRRVATS